MLTEPMHDETQAEKATEPEPGFAVRAVASLAAALQFLTIVPPLVRRPFREAELAGALHCFALVGLGLGAVLMLLDQVLLRLFPSPLASALVLAAWIVLTGALHLDGFFDTCDGLFGGRTPEDRLRIMRDHRVGAFAVIGGVLLLLIKFQALAVLSDATTALLLAPVLGRTAMVLVVVAFPYARAEGLGRAMKDHARWVHVVLPIATALVVAGRLAGPLGLVAMGSAALLALAAGWFASRRLGGLTGDLYGALCEIVEVLTLLVLVAGMPHAAPAP